jgi:outer membrane beta-barrel protein
MTRTIRTALAGAIMAAFAGPVNVLAVEPIDRELEKYWNVEQAVPSLQNPLFERAGGFEGTLHAGMIPNDSFYVPLPVGAKAGFFVTDSVSVEGSFSWLLGGKSGLREFLECAGHTANNKCIVLTEGAKQPPQMQWLASLDVGWTPVHGKFGIFTQKLSSFDLGVYGGVGFINGMFDASDVLLNTSAGEKAPQAALRVGGHFGAGFRFFLTRWMNLRLDYRQFVYKAGTLEATVGEPEAANVLWPAEFTLGVAFLSK